MGGLAVAVDADDVNSTGRVTNVEGEFGEVTVGYGLIRVLNA